MPINPSTQAQGNPENTRGEGGSFEARPALDSMKQEVGKKSLQDALGTWLSDPEKRQELMAAGIAGVMMYLFKNEKVEERERSNDAGHKDALRMEMEGTIKNENPKATEEDRVKKEPKEAKENERVTDLRLIAVNIHAALNKTNSEKLAKKGILLPPNLSKMGSISLLKSGLGSYEEFENHLCITLQPDLKDRNKQIENVAEIMSLCALGKYQILARHHFDTLGWNWQGKEGLKNMYKFLRSNETQNDLNHKILANLWKRYNGNVEAIAAAYYGGPECGNGIVKYQQAKKEGKLDGMDWLDKKQTFGYGSINHYSSSVLRFFEQNKKQEPGISEIDALQKAIARQESGYLAGKQAVPKNVA